MRFGNSAATEWLHCVTRSGRRQNIIFPIPLTSILAINPVEWSLLLISLVFHHLHPSHRSKSSRASNPSGIKVTNHTRTADSNCLFQRCIIMTRAVVITTSAFTIRGILALLQHVCMRASNTSLFSRLLLIRCSYYFCFSRSVCRSY